MCQKQLIQQVSRFFIIICAIFIFAGQAFCADSQGTNASEKLQTLKQQVKKILPAPKPKRVSPSSFNPEMPLRDAIDILRNCTVPPLNISVLWKDLDENADIQRDTPIGIDGVSGVTLKTHLELLLMSLSSGALSEIGYVVDGGVIIIATKESLPKKVSTRIYDISDLVAPPSTGGMMPGMGMPGMGMGMMGMGIGMMGMGGMPFGNMMSYGLGGLLGGLSPYGNTGYMNQGYMNQGYMNQGYMNQQQAPLGYSPM